MSHMCERGQVSQLMDLAFENDGDQIQQKRLRRMVDELLDDEVLNSVTDYDGRVSPAKKSTCFSAHAKECDQLTTQSFSNVSESVEQKSKPKIPSGLWQGWKVGVQAAALGTNQSGKVRN